MDWLHTTYLVHSTLTSNSDNHYQISNAMPAFRMQVCHTQMKQSTWHTILKCFVTKFISIYSQEMLFNFIEHPYHYLAYLETSRNIINMR